MTTPYIGCRISLISKNDVRYEGTLNGIDSVQSEVILQNVQCFGTEDRRTENPVQPSQDTYGFIRFRGSDIKDLHVSEFPPFHDESMMQGNYGFPRGFMPQYGYGYGNPYQYHPYLQYNYEMMGQPMRPMGELPLDAMGMHDTQAFNMQGYPMYNYDPSGGFNSPLGQQFQNPYAQSAAQPNDPDAPPSVPKEEQQSTNDKESTSKPIEVTNPQDPQSKEKSSETKTPSATPKETSVASQEESSSSANQAVTNSNNKGKNSSGLVYQPKKKPQNQTEQQNKSSPAPVKSQPQQNNTHTASANNTNTAAKKETIKLETSSPNTAKTNNKSQNIKDKQYSAKPKSIHKPKQQNPKQSNGQQAVPVSTATTPSVSFQAPVPQSAITPDSPATQESRNQSNKQEQHGGRGGYRNNNRGRNHNRRRGHPSTGKFTGSDTPTTVFEEEFDFASSLAKFDKEKFVDNLNDDDNEALPPPTYEKSSFFDNISCEALERETEEKLDRKTLMQQQRKLDTETFGTSHSKSTRNYRGRGGRTHRGGRGNHNHQRQDRNGEQNKIYKPKATTEVKASPSNN